MRIANWWLSVAVLSLLGGAGRAADTEPLSAVLEKLRVQHQVPGLAAAAFIDGKVVDATAVGVRKAGDSTPVTVEDRWHIGSCTKAMTATLAAMYVEEGRLRWNTTVGEVFPEALKKMDGKWPTVTLEQLLTHRAGAPAKPAGPLWMIAWQRSGSERDQRLAFTYGLLQLPQEAEAGTKYIYSNQGYAIAGAMMERILDRPWEDLLRERLFKPLGMKSSGFGAPGTASKLDQPWGHAGKEEDLRPMEPGPGADNPPAIGPGGTVHCSISDLARFAGAHAQESRGTPELLKSATTWQKLHTSAAGQSYAMGWDVTTRPWAGGRTLTHAGSNTMWYAVMWVAPERNAAFVAASNAATGGATKACDAAVSELVRRHLAARPQ